MARRKPWRIPHAYSPCHASGDEWMQRNWEVQVEFPSSISAFTWAIDLEWAQA
jgi:hypothetical protein